MKLRIECPGCGLENYKNKKIFFRNFTYCKNLTPFESYQVFKCNRCGLLYAGDIIESQPLNAYYKSMSRYEGDNYTISSDLVKQYKFIVQVFADKLKHDAEILDVGCAFGGLLNEFKQIGFNNVYGLEPSAKNSQYAMNKFGIKVYPGLLGNVVFTKKFDMVILCAVMEHLMDLHSSIVECKKLIKNDGIFVVVVPDLALFSEHTDLYQEFSAEHINYFSISALQNIMKTENFFLDVYSQNHESAMGLAGNMITGWKLEESPSPRPSENLSDLLKSAVSGNNSFSDEDALLSYMNRCELFANKLKKRISQYNINEGCYIWGAGTNTAMLVQLGILPITLIKGVFDSNLNYEGLVAYGHPVQQPIKLKNAMKLPIIIASQYAFSSIKSNIEDMGLTNKVIDIFGLTD